MKADIFWLFMITEELEDRNNSDISTNAVQTPKTEVSLDVHVT